MEEKRDMFNPTLLCPDCECVVKIDSFSIIARYIANGTNIPAGNSVMFYGICPKCGDPVALTHNGDMAVQDFNLNDLIKELGTKYVHSLYVRSLKTKRRKEVVN